MDKKQPIRLFFIWVGIDILSTLFYNNYVEVEMENFKNFSTKQISESLASEREEKYKKLGQMTKEEKMQFYTDQALRIREQVQLFGAEIQNLDMWKIEGESDRPMVALDTCVLHKLDSVLKEKGEQSAEEFYNSGTNSYKKAKKFYRDIIKRIRQFYLADGRGFDENAQNDKQILRKKFNYYIKRSREKVVIEKEGKTGSLPLYKALTKVIFQATNAFLPDKFWREDPNTTLEYQNEKREELDKFIEVIFQKAGKADKYDYFDCDLSEIVDYLTENAIDQRRFVKLLAEINGCTCDFSQIQELYQDKKITNCADIVNKATSILRDMRKFKAYGKKLDGEKLCLIEMLRFRERGVFDFCIMEENLDELISHLNGKSSVKINEDGMRRLLSVCRPVNIKFDYERNKLNKIYQYVSDLSDRYMKKPKDQAGSVMPNVQGSLGRESDPICMAESSVVGCLYVTANAKDYIQGEKSRIDDVRRHIIKVNSQNPYATDIIPLTLNEFVRVLKEKNKVEDFVHEKPAQSIEPNKEIKYQSRERLISIIKDENGVYKMVGDPKILPSSGDVLVFCQTEIFLNGDMPKGDDKENE